jgi:bifunctional non-homologous end joining protein LigD
LAAVITASSMRIGKTTAQESGRALPVRAWRNLDQGEMLETGTLRRGRVRARGLRGPLKLRLARREPAGLIYVGRVGTGWDRKTALDVRRALEPLVRPTSPLPKALRKADTIWVEPRLDAEITYAEITSDGMVRQPSFKALLPYHSGR